MTEGGDTNSGNGKGRFVTGNNGGPGGPRRRTNELRRAAEEAITTEHVAAIMRRFTRMALEGNLAAARLVLERVCGRAAEAPVEAEPVGIALPRLRTASDCNFAIEQLVDGIAKGQINPDVAKVLIDAIQVRLKAIETVELEQRLIELEKNARTVDPNGRR